MASPPAPDFPCRINTLLSELLAEWEPVGAADPDPAVRALGPHVDALCQETSKLVAPEWIGGMDAQQQREWFSHIASLEPALQQTLALLRLYRSRPPGDRLVDVHTLRAALAGMSL